MYSLKLTVHAEAEPFSSGEYHCRASKDGSIIAALFSEQDESYGFDYYNLFLGIYFIK